MNSYVCYSAGQTTSNAIDQQIRRDGQAKVVKLLLLGPGDSGKSTIVKQMSTDELISRKAIIYNNIIQQLAMIVGVMDELAIEIEDPTLKTDALLIAGLSDAGKATDPLSDYAVSAVTRLWADAGVRRCYERRAEYQLNDSFKYFVESVERIAAVDYMPTVQDMLMSRVSTSGIVQVDFRLNDAHFRVFDVGGQRSERKKWIHCFDDVTAVLFVVAISEYDQNLREDEKTNRLRESLRLFESICNSRYFINSSMILLLNKIDLFREKIERMNSPLALYFSSYQASSYESAVEYMDERFSRLHRASATASTMLTVHETCATDCDQVQRVVGVIQGIVQDCVIQETVSYRGLPPLHLKTGNSIESPLVITISCTERLSNATKSAHITCELPSN